MLYYIFYQYVCNPCLCNYSFVIYEPSVILFISSHLKENKLGEILISLNSIVKVFLLILEGYKF